MAGEARPIDPDVLKATARQVFEALGGAMTSAMIYLGDQLGLYRALAGGEPVTSTELAERTGLHERWLREWLYQQGAAGLLEHLGDERFALSPEAGAVLADESHPAFGAGFFSYLPQTLGVAEQLPESFRTGVGLPYDAFGEQGAAGIERGFAPWFRAMLVPLALPRIDGLIDRLAEGIEVADVGCGSGIALLELARSFPHARFRGYDISRHALERAEANRAETGVDNASFHDAAVDPLPADGRFGFMTTFDCLHDMTDPAGVIRAIRAAIAEDGVWLIADIKAQPDYASNVEHNPMAAMMYGTSVLTCMSSALSEPDGLGLGTLGLHAGLVEQLVREAGFSKFEQLDLGHPVNAFYLVRP
ncbi:MAG: methyltransferase domain-containing protein [Myxococcota bacterium]|nr:methyltransferase domain-containing protein [Myxococcota bacterium]